MIVPNDLFGEIVLYTEDTSSHVTPVTIGNCDWLPTIVK